MGPRSSGLHPTPYSYFFPMGSPGGRGFLPKEPAGPVALPEDDRGGRPLSGPGLTDRANDLSLRNTRRFGPPPRNNLLFISNSQVGAHFADIRPTRATSTVASARPAFPQTKAKQWAGLPLHWPSHGPTHSQRAAVARSGSRIRGTASTAQPWGGTAALHNLHRATLLGNIQGASGSPGTAQGTALGHRPCPAPREGIPQAVTSTSTGFNVLSPGESKRISALGSLDRRTASFRTAWLRREPLSHKGRKKGLKGRKSGSKGERREERRREE